MSTNEPSTPNWRSGATGSQERPGERYDTGYLIAAGDARVLPTLISMVTLLSSLLRSLLSFLLSSLLSSMLSSHEAVTVQPTQAATPNTHSVSVSVCVCVCVCTYGYKSDLSRFDLAVEITVR